MEAVREHIVRSRLVLEGFGGRTEKYLEVLEEGVDAKEAARAAK